MDYIEIAEWDKFQHYKKRNPPWVKLYSWFLDDDDFDCMPDDSKLLFFCLLSFASRRNNRIRLNFRWLQKKLPIEKDITQETLQPLIDAGFITCKHDDSTVIADDKHSATPETKTKTEQEREQEAKTLNFAIKPDFIFKWLDDEIQFKTQFERNTFGKYSRELAVHPDVKYINGHIAALIQDCKLEIREGRSERINMVKIVSNAISNKLKG